MDDGMTVVGLVLFVFLGGFMLGLGIGIIIGLEKGAEHRA